MANKVLADIILRGGQRLLRLVIDQTLLKASELPEPVVKKRGSVTGKIAGAAATRIATKSVPGAIIVGGGLLAKTLYERNKARKNG